MSESFLSEIKDNRRKEGRRYESGHIPLFTISAIAGGACPYGKVHTFIKGNYGTLREEFGLKRKKIPAYTAIRNIISGLSVSDSEECFRKYSPELSGLPEEMSNMIFIACDGRTLRGSSDNFQDKKAIQILSAFISDSGIIPAHCGAGEKTDGIPVAQKLMKESESENCVFTYDAPNCQEKTLKAAEENNNDVTVCVGENRKELLNNCSETCELGLPCPVYGEPVVRERNRTERRKAPVSEDMIITDKKNGKMSVRS